MGASLIDEIKEAIREEVTDDKFYKNGPYAFVLRGPPMKGSVGPLGYSVFPLPVNPTDESYVMPFACEITPLQEGGVVAEEAGICIGELSIEGSTGFKTRLAKDTSFGPGGGDFTGLLGHGWAGAMEISGQLAFWRLANRCFDAYSAMKKDPASASQTMMEFHSQKDELHLQIVPREFALRRSAGRERVSYHYSIRAAVVGAAGKLFLPSPDVSMIQKIKGTIAKIRDTIQKVAAVIDDVTAALDTIRRTISSVVSILTDLAQVVNSFTAVMDGTKEFLDIPRQALVNLTVLIESTAGLVSSATGWPADVAQAFFDMGDQVDALIVASTDLRVTSWQQQADRYQRLVRDRFGTIGSKQFADTVTGELDTGFSIEAVWSAERPGDIRRAEAMVDPGERMSSRAYQGFAEFAVGQGDTIQSLAAKHLGDARRWLDLAVINDLKAPYLSNVSLPGTLKVGDKIMIPIIGGGGGASVDTITSGAAATGASQSDMFLGEDFKMIKLADGVFGWEIDLAGGSIDVLKVTGIPNIAQALEMRFRTEQGTNILYPSIGLPRLVGIGAFGSKLADARYQARAQLLADKRIERLARFDFHVENDALFLDADVQPVGYSTTRTISRTLT